MTSELIVEDARATLVEDKIASTPETPTEANDSNTTASRQDEPTDQDIEAILVDYLNFLDLYATAQSNAGTAFSKVRLDEAKGEITW